MKPKLLVVLSMVIVAVTILTACGGAALRSEEPIAEEVFPQEAPAPGFDNAGIAPEGEMQKVAPMPTGGVEYSTLPDVAPQSVRADHLIIKNADISILVKDSEVAIDRLTQVVGDVDGYIISSRVWFQDYYAESYKYASVTIGVPVDQFELAMRRIRGLSLKVLDEKASGEDVTDQFVDLQSRLANLEATRERIKGFLDQAKTVDEALRINQELSAIEAQIEEVKGRMNYLSDRAAFSTITVTISPELPEIEPTPQPTPAPWNPGNTLNDALDTLVDVYQGLVEFGIWLVVVILPILGPPILLVWLLVKFFRRKVSKPSAGNEE